jgi:hypothetical protein
MLSFKDTSTTRGFLHGGLLEELGIKVDDYSAGDQEGTLNPGHSAYFNES